MIVPIAEELNEEDEDNTQNIESKSKPLNYKKASTSKNLEGEETHKLLKLEESKDSNR